MSDLTQPALAEPDADAPGPPAAPGARRSAGVQDPYAVRIAWTDLVGNRPGQAAREQAVARRRAAPFKTFAARVLRVHTDERAWRVGADGEEKIAARLARLPGTWRVLHAVPVGTRGSDIDHLVVGPGGVFTVNTKHHPGAAVWVGGATFLVNGQRQPYVRNSRHEAQRAARLLSAAVAAPVAVSAMIAVVGADPFTVKSQPEGVHVVGRRQLPNWLSGLRVTLSEEQVAAVFQAARRSDTWQ